MATEDAQDDASAGPGVRFARWVFLVAAVYGIAVLVPQYFLEGKLGRDYPPPITHPEHFYGFIGVALAWQILFLFVAGNPIRYRPIIVAAVLEKLAFGLACLFLYSAGRIATTVLGAGVIDLILAVFFVLSYRALGEHAAGR